MIKAHDPQGNIIILTKECWDNHICVNHIEMKLLINEIKEAIVNPDYIYQGKSSIRSHLYFKAYPNSTLNCKYILVAVYRKPDLKNRYVQSAYPVKSLSKGGVLEWQKP